MITRVSNYNQNFCAAGFPSGRLSVGSAVTNRQINLANEIKPFSHMSTVVGESIGGACACLITHIAGKSDTTNATITVFLLAVGALLGCVFGASKIK